MAGPFGRWLDRRPGAGLERRGAAADRLLLDALAPRYLRTEPRGDRTRDTEFSRSALWWPPSKIAARHLAPYLANPEPHLAAEGPLADRAPEPAADSVDANHREFAELALALADENARWGEFGTALRCLDAVEALDGMLPPGYAGKRREWSGRLRPGAATPGGRP